MVFLTTPDLLRLLLFSGLVLHKALWESLKSRTKVSPRRPLGSLQQVLKLGKVVALLFLVVQTLFLNIFPITTRPESLQVLGSGIWLLGLITAILGRLRLGTNWKDIEDIRLASPDSLVKDGIYAYIRHPIYAGDMLLLIGLELALNSWLMLAMVFPIFIFAKQALSEESLLAQTFRDYMAYSRNTKRFIPFVI